jgi:hypothetical protein
LSVLIIWAIFPLCMLRIKWKLFLLFFFIFHGWVTCPTVRSFVTLFLITINRAPRSGGNTWAGHVALVWEARSKCL